MFLVRLLKELLTQNANSNSYYFLRWVDKVSGIVENLPPDFEQNSSPEGQMFNSELELRWKRKGSGFEVLLLTEGDSLPGKWETIENGCEWETEVRDACLYQPTVTRFPNRFKYPDNLKIAQRYFKFLPQAERLARSPDRRFFAGCDRKVGHEVAPQIFGPIDTLAPNV